MAIGSGQPGVALRGLLTQWAMEGLGVRESELAAQADAAAGDLCRTPPPLPQRQAFDAVARRDPFLSSTAAGTP